MADAWFTRLNGREFKFAAERVTVAWDGCTGIKYTPGVTTLWYDNPRNSDYMGTHMVLGLFEDIKAALKTGGISKEQMRDIVQRREQYVTELRAEARRREKEERALMYG